MAALATALIGSPGKLAGMCILMAITTKLMRQLFFEIAAAMTFLTRNLAMHSTQGKVG